MGLSIPTLIGQLIPLLSLLVIFVVGLRFLLAATRLMNRKADEIEYSVSRLREGEKDDQRPGENSNRLQGGGFS